MKSTWRAFLVSLILLLADTLCLGLLWVAAWQIRNIMTAINGGGLLPINPLDSYLVVLPKMLIGWVAVLAGFRAYRHKGKISSLNEVRDIYKTALGLFFATIFVDFVFRHGDISRAVIFTAAAFHAIYLYASRSLLRYIKTQLRERGIGLIRAAVIGAGDTGRRVARHLRTHPEIGYELVGFIDKKADELESQIDGVPVIGSSENLADTLIKNGVEEVFLAIPSLNQNDTLNLVVQCEAAKVHFKIVKQDLIEVIAERVKIDDIGEFPVIQLKDGHLHPFSLAVKRVLDLIMVSVALVLASPLFVGVAIAVRMSSEGPVLFSHDRVGQDGKIFRLHKFRTMYHNTNPYQVAPGDQSDSRITPIGRFLRSSSLDELPQLFNVLKGDMSMVGPRPEMPFIVETYEPWQRRRLDVPQGITGIWQISGRKDLPLHFNLEYDFYYIRNWSILLDISILLRTVPAVLFRKGAF